METEILDSCPFCNSANLDVKKRTYDSEKIFRIKCDSCGSMSGEYDSIHKAIVAWNRRA